MGVSPHSKPFPPVVWRNAFFLALFPPEISCKIAQNLKYNYKGHKEITKDIKKKNFECFVPGLCPLW